MLLFSTYYKDKNCKRQEELDFVLVKNIENDFIKKIILFCEDLPLIKLTNKVEIVEVDKRMKFQDIIYFSNKYPTTNIKIICNSDIFFDETIGIVHKELDRKSVYCLTRWDFIEEGNLAFYQNFKSQDAWIFRDKLPKNIGNYYMGLPGCDNRFAKELLDSGYNVKNPSLTINAIHVHGSNLRNYHKTKDRVIGEYTYPLPTELRNYKTERGQMKEYEIRLKFLHRKWRNDLDGINFTFLDRLKSKIISFYLKHR